MENLDEPNVVEVVDIVHEDQVRPQGLVMGFLSLPMVTYVERLVNLSGPRAREV